MDTTQWKRARDLFDAAAELSPDRRDDFLRRECTDDIVLAQVLAMLRADSEAAQRTSLSAQALGLFEGLAPETDEDAPTARDGHRFGAWKIIRELARGGMGTVYLAERVDGDFTQQAALKVVLDTGGTADVLARFRYERQILADLTHPNIARLLDGGAGPTGEPFLAMEYIEGTDLRSYCDAKALDIDARLRLFLTVCDAVAYAHDHLVLHRDLKPANILVSTDGVVKLLDFGVAKLVDPHVPEDTTVAAQRLFTPEYAAPEQIRGEVSTVTADVYSLGVVLYELLTGRRPYRLKGRSAADIAQAILNVEPTLPSTRETADTSKTGRAAPDPAPTRSTTTSRLRKRLRGDLDAIVLKSLRKSPDHRYPSVAAFANDIRAHLAHRPVVARRGSRRYRVTRYIQRNAAAVALVSLASVSLMAGTAIALWQAREAGKQRDAALVAQAAAESEARKSKATLDFMNRLFDQADPGSTRGASVTAREILAEGAARIRDDLDQQPGVRAEMMTAIGKAQLGLGLNDESLAMLRDAGTLNETTLDAHADTLMLQANALSRLGRPQDAVDLLEPLRARMVDEAITPEKLATIDRILGLLYEDTQRMDEAEAALNRALAVQEAVLGPSHSQTQETLLSIADLLSTQGRNDEAMPIAERAVDAARMSDSADPVHLATALTALGRILHNASQLQRAEAARREVLSLITQVFGTDHPATSTSQSALGSTLAAQFRYDEAIDLHSEALRGVRSRSDANSPWVADHAIKLAASLNSAGRTSEAGALAREALHINIANFGESHYRSALASSILGAIQVDEANYRDAQTSLEQALDAWEETLGPDSPYLINTLLSLGAARLLGGLDDPGCEAGTRVTRIIDDNDDSEEADAIHGRALLDACLALTRGQPAWLPIEDATKRLTRMERVDPHTLVVLRRVAAALRARR